MLAFIFNNLGSSIALKTLLFPQYNVIYAELSPQERKLTKIIGRKAGTLSPDCPQDKYLSGLLKTFYLMAH